MYFFLYFYFFYLLGYFDFLPSWLVLKVITVLVPSGLAITSGGAENSSPASAHESSNPVDIIMDVLDCGVVGWSNKDLVIFYLKIFPLPLTN